MVFSSHEVRVGELIIGGNQPLVLQSMTNTDTNAVDETVKQCMKIVEAGADLVRISAKNTTELQALRNIHSVIQKMGLCVPLIADIHFSASLAVEAAGIVEKVRINPGNFSKSDEAVSDLTYMKEIRHNLKPLIESCVKNNTAIRIGTNHGSLSARIRKKFGSGPRAMAEASMEFVRILADMGFQNAVLSVKASNALENIIATRLLAEMQLQEGYSYPLHIGVTEAGLGFSGRIKSAVGIGALLADGIGDTIRVSLTESPEHEIPVARQLAELFHPKKKEYETLSAFTRLFSTEKENIDFQIIGSRRAHWLPGLHPDVFSDELDTQSVVIIETGSRGCLYEFRQQYVERLQEMKGKKVIWKLNAGSDEWFDLSFAASLGNLISYGVPDACWIDGEDKSAVESMRVLYEVLQVCNIRNSHAEFISCPSCNRTSFDILNLAEEVRSRTFHHKELTIAVMGCIVNGPGEMGNADYGLVGHGKGLLALYKQGVMIEKDIPEAEACNRLLREIEKGAKQ
jgi:(E)-4-hydroxy-3-methylbut-2-enyl-diphosphate synthase